jgi:hypothetical protein
MLSISGMGAFLSPALDSNASLLKEVPRTFGAAQNPPAAAKQRQLLRAGRDLKAAEEFFAMARTASSPFMRAYYQRVAERYLSSQAELRCEGGLTRVSLHGSIHKRGVDRAAPYPLDLQPL